MTKTALAILLCLSCCSIIAQDTITRKKYFTQRMNGSITLDGKPTEEAWNAVEWGGDFTQWQPNEGKAPGQPTNFKILYDDKYLYIAYRAWDSRPDSIRKFMSRRDEFPGDWVEINIDSYHDLRTAFSFTLSVSGVRGDEFVSNDGNNWDANWNPIWFAKTSIDDKGWTGEVKIPFSQLRYGNEAEKTWGIQVTRRLFRKEERSTWQLIPQTSGVWVSRFGELHGLKNIPVHKQIEIAPYITAQLDTYKKQEGNPFAKGKDAKLNAGVDGKIAITNDLILDFTINPDFGQVEADPSQVRLDGYQNFFSERRPFFIESRNIFDYQLTGSAAGGDYDADLLFYSRRIGSSPHGYPSTTAGEYVKFPANTSILGAAKFSGKTKKGLSIGILESITQREMATIDKNGVRREELVEPLTSFFVGRVQKDYNGGNTVIGGIITSVNREKGLDFLHKSAMSGGFDFLHFWRNRAWYIRGNIIFSHVTGTKEAILNTQTAFEHLFQRPDAKGLSFDANKTSLTGTGGTVRFGKSGGKPGKHGRIFRMETGVTYRSPELELNDIGFMLTANEINHFYWMALQYPRSFSIFRNARINYNHWSRWDFGGKHLWQGFNTNVHATFTNNWQTGAGFSWVPLDISNNALRGASAFRQPGGASHFLYVNTDFRKKINTGFEISNVWGFDHSVRENNVSVYLNLQPMNNLRINLSGGYTYYWRRQDQYVSTASYNGMVRSIVGQISQRTLRFTARATFNITPDLTIQYYGQPFITRPQYTRFAYVSNAMAKNYDSRFYVYHPAQVSLNNGTYFIDENMDGTGDYSFSVPDFNFVQFRSNAVLRWEYKPGSEFYLVWSQGNTDVSTDFDKPVFNSLFSNAFANQARNIFLMKWTYRFLK